MAVQPHIFVNRILFASVTITRLANSTMEYYCNNLEEHGADMECTFGQTENQSNPCRNLSSWDQFQPQAFFCVEYDQPYVFLLGEFDPDEINGNFSH